LVVLLAEQHVRVATCESPVLELLFVPSVLPETLGGPQGRVMTTRGVIFMVEERYE